MNPTSVDIKDLLVAEAGFVFGTDLFISTQPPTPTNCVTIFDTTSSPPDGTLDGEKVFFQEGLMFWIRNTDYQAAYLQAQAIIGVLHNRAGFTLNETFYLYSNLVSGINAVGEGSEGEDVTLTLNFNLQRKSTIVPAADYLTFVKLVAALVAGTNVTLTVDSVNQTITINSEGGSAATITMRNNGTYIQYSNDGGETWTNIISIAAITGPQGTPGRNGINGTNGTNGVDGEDGLDGADGKNPEFQKSATHIQWRLVGDVTWLDLVALADLKGDKGDQGDPGVTTISAADDVDATDKGVGKILQVGADGINHQYVDMPTGGLGKTFQTLTEAATITFDASISVNGSVTLTASRILGNITNAVVGEVHCVKVIQGGSGSYALTYGNQYKFSGGVLPILSATVGAVDLLFFLAVSATEFHFINANFDVKTP